MSLSNVTDDEMRQIVEKRQASIGLVALIAATLGANGISCGRPEVTAALHVLADLGDLVAAVPLQSTRVS